MKDKKADFVIKMAAGVNRFSFPPVWFAVKTRAFLKVEAIIGKL